LVFGILLFAITKPFPLRSSLFVVWLLMLLNTGLRAKLKKNPYLCYYNTFPF
jgi:hypothetical protein